MGSSNSGRQLPPSLPLQFPGDRFKAVANEEQVRRKYFNHETWAKWHPFLQGLQINVKNVISGTKTQRDNEPKWCSTN
jgi:hypothetical protein